MMFSFNYILSTHGSLQGYSQLLVTLDLVLLKLENTVQKLNEPEAGTSQHMKTC